MIISLDKILRFNIMTEQCLELTGKHLTKHSCATCLIVGKVSGAPWGKRARNRKQRVNGTLSVHSAVLEIDYFLINVKWLGCIKIGM